MVQVVILLSECRERVGGKAEALLKMEVSLSM